MISLASAYVNHCYQIYAKKPHLKKRTQLWVDLPCIRYKSEHLEKSEKHFQIMLPNKSHLLSEIENKNFEYRFSHIKWLYNTQKNVISRKEKFSSFAFNIKTKEQCMYRIEPDLSNIVETAITVAKIQLIMKQLKNHLVVPMILSIIRYKYNQ